MNILVTGGAGFIGRWVVKKLAEDNHKIWILDNLSNGSINNIQTLQFQYPSITFVKGDIKDTHILEALFTNNFDLCYHLAASINVQDSIDDPKSTFQNDIIGTFNVLQQCRLNKTKFIYMSTCMVYSVANSMDGISESHPTCPSSPYAASKLAGEQIALSFYHAYGLPVTILRPFNTYGEYQKQNSEGGVISIFIMKNLLSAPLVIYGDGSQTRDFLYVTDCADFVVNSGYSEKTNGKVINAGTGIDTSITDLAKLIIGNDGTIKYVPHIHPQSEIQKLLCDASYANELINWKPKVSLSDGILMTKEFLKKQLLLE